MNNIDLDLLIPINEKNGKLNVISLFDTERARKPDINKLIKTREMKKINLKNCYKNILRTTYKAINEATNFGKTDVIYKIPHVQVKNKLYNPIDCLLYVEKKLRSMKFETLKLNNYSLFITWFNITRD